MSDAAVVSSAERWNALSARDDYLVFNVAAAFVELSTDKIDLFWC